MHERGKRNRNVEGKGERKWKIYEISTFGQECYARERGIER